MQSKLFGKPGLIICFLLVILTAYAQQYTVTGGRGTPLLAHHDTANKIEVYLVYGMDGVEISYTSTSSNHQWFRYKTKVNESEAVTSSQNGNTSLVTHIDGGYGYYVKEQGQLDRYVWIIDYSQYAFDITSLRVSENSNVCESFLLTGEYTMPQLSYHSINGVPLVVNRTFEISYYTLDYNEESKIFTTKDTTCIVSGNPFQKSYDAPLIDTDIWLRGDYFARHFNVEKEINTGEYATVAIKIDADTTVVSQESPNMDSSKEGYSAPVTIRFVAYGNDPVAADYKWRIYRDGETLPIIDFTSDEVEYTFNRAGSYRALLEVGDRTNSCQDSLSFVINVAESFLAVPNAFSPGMSPGVNDEFKVSYKSLVRFKGWIFNRWGVQLFHWTDPAVGWDGKKGGKYVSPGVYFYVIEAEGSDGTKYKKKGDINILRSKTVQDEVIEQ
ncbi:gliding motility-associated C-terminal domain-containing protein [Parabacteroides sp. PF5-9]|uniref:T9SS type B sorting domain-containing protein n=1 Tax=Parabacteroides sp. PF5-9 TaxID=1742404 RepID=UPI002475B27D|nr:gliding motility-associated C-terminal domain-containing protein [Parabacteroides sp. PF5-9]MDH6358781.1 hypothetical protein [Parabacteroides sp. PF5-9]